jgi:hypothetical protein
MVLVFTTFMSIRALAPAAVLTTPHAVRIHGYRQPATINALTCAAATTVTTAALLDSTVFHLTSHNFHSLFVIDNQYHLYLRKIHV